MGKIKRDSLGDRMKSFYETIPKTRLMRRCPVIIRIDGKAFHTFTRGFVRPFDDVLIQTMQDTAKYLCENVQGCVLAYTQSDEISLLLIDYKTFDTSAWFDYEVQKMCSVSASMATLAFNVYFRKNIEAAESTGTLKQEYADVYRKAAIVGAMFDSRVFNIPREEVTNYFYWRQLDATRNSIQMVGQAYFRHKELMLKSCNDIQDMLWTQFNINWNDFPTHKKRGSCIVRGENWVIGNGEPIFMGENWVVGKEIPIFKGENRDYIECYVNMDQEEK